MKKIVLAALLVLFTQTAQAQVAEAPTSATTKQVTAFPGLFVAWQPTFNTAQTRYLPYIVWDQPVILWRWVVGSDSYCAYECSADTTPAPMAANALEAVFDAKSCGVITTELFNLEEHPSVQLASRCDYDGVVLTITPIGVTGGK